MIAADIVKFYYCAIGALIPLNPSFTRLTIYSKAPPIEIRDSLIMVLVQLSFLTVTVLPVSTRGLLPPASSSSLTSRST
uniref:Uncharacterized protein n=1 Tax=Triticum urartu TaxID=4572 RepID=A0A8R7TKL3_TRIUA